jgi:hypothetical protein
MSSHAPFLLVHGCPLRYVEPLNLAPSWSAVGYLETCGNRIPGLLLRFNRISANLSEDLIPLCLLLLQSYPKTQFLPVNLVVRFLEINSTFGDRNWALLGLSPGNPFAQQRTCPQRTLTDLHTVNLSSSLAV